MTTLYIPQNINHLKNIVCQELTRDDIVIDLTGVMGESHEFDKAVVPCSWKRIEPVFPDPYYSLSRWKPICALISIKKELKSYLKDKKINRVCIYNDGSIQRSALNIIGKDVVVEMHVDGLLYSPVTLKDFLIKAVYVILSRVYLGDFSPSYVGCSKKVDVIYVISNQVKESLKNWGVKEEKIFIKELPRFKDFIVGAKEFSENHVQQSDSRVRCTYFTSAFLWHGKRRLDEIQQKDIGDFIEFCRKESFLAVIRVHPREEVHRYISNFSYEDVVITDASTPLYEDIILSDFLFTACSSVSIEAELLNKKVIVTRMNFSDNELPSEVLGGVVLHSYDYFHTLSNEPMRESHEVL